MTGRPKKDRLVMFFKCEVCGKDCRVEYTNRFTTKKKFCSIECHRKKLKEVMNRCQAYYEVKKFNKLSDPSYRWSDDED
jgi:hypothetical protein